MQHFYPIIHAGRRPRHRLSGIMRGGFVLVLSALMLPAAANAAAESSATATVNPQNTGGGGAGTTRKSREQQEEAGTAGRSREQCGCRNARNARQRRPPREPAVGGNLPGRQRAAHGRKRAAGGQQSVGQAVASRIEKISCTYKQPATAARCTHRHGGSPGHRESEIASEPCRLGSGKNHAGKQVLSTEIPEILRIREIQRMFTNYHKKELKKVVF